MMKEKLYRTIFLCCQVPINSDLLHEVNIKTEDAHKILIASISEVETQAKDKMRKSLRKFYSVNMNKN